MCKNRIVDIILVIVIGISIFQNIYIILAYPQFYYNSEYELHYVKITEYNTNCSNDVNGCGVMLNFVNVDYTKSDYMRRVKNGASEFYEYRFHKSVQEVEYYKNNYNNTYVWSACCYGNYFKVGTIQKTHYSLIITLCVLYLLCIAGLFFKDVTIIGILMTIFVGLIVGNVVYMIFIHPEILYGKEYELYHVKINAIDYDFYKNNTNQTYIQMHFTNIDFTRVDYNDRLNKGITEYTDAGLYNQYDTIDIINNYNNTYVYAAMRPKDYFKPGTQFPVHYCSIVLLVAGYIVILFVINFKLNKGKKVNNQII